MEPEGPFPTATATYLSQIYPLHNDHPHFLKINLNIIFPPTPKFSIWSLTFLLLFQNSLALLIISPSATCPAHHFLLGWITWTIFSEQCRSRGSPSSSFMQRPVTAPLPLGPKHFPQHPFPLTSLIYFPPSVRETKFHIHPKQQTKLQGVYTFSLYVSHSKRQENIFSTEWYQTSHVFCSVCS
jgi:hypothetical protein